MFGASKQIIWEAPSPSDSFLWSFCLPSLPHNQKPFASCTCKCCICQTEAVEVLWKADEYITYSHKLNSDINNFKVLLFFVQQDEKMSCQQLQAVFNVSISKVSKTFKNNIFDKSILLIKDEVCNDLVFSESTRVHMKLTCYNLSLLTITVLSVQKHNITEFIFVIYNCNKQSRMFQ